MDHDRSGASLASRDSSFISALRFYPGRLFQIFADVYRRRPSQRRASSHGFLIPKEPHPHQHELCPKSTTPRPQ